MGSPPFVIGLAGPMRTGKSTVVRAMDDLIDLPREEKVVLSFAEPLRQGLLKMGICKKNTPDLYREAAQVVGTDIARRHNPNHWVDLMRDNIKDQEAYGVKYVLIDDVRFPNEVGLCNFTVRLTNPPYGKTNGIAGHASEAGNFKVNLEIPNEGTPEDTARLILTAIGGVPLRG